MNSRSGRFAVVFLLAMVMLAILGQATVRAEEDVLPSDQEMVGGPVVSQPFCGSDMSCGGSSCGGFDDGGSLCGGSSCGGGSCGFDDSSCGGGFCGGGGCGFNLENLDQIFSKLTDFIQRVISLVRNLIQEIRNIFKGNGGGSSNTGGGEVNAPPPGDSGGGSTTVSQPPTDSNAGGGNSSAPGGDQTAQNPPAQPPADSSTSGNTYGGKLEFINFPPSKNLSNSSWGPLLTDIENHLPPKYGTQYRDQSPSTHAHETTHGINSHIRNYMNKTGRKANGFYVGNNRAVVLVEPNVRKSAAVPYVPNSLRGSRFNLYLLGMSAWDDTPLYIFDEWVAYTNGALVAVDQVKRGLWRQGWTDAVHGALEFTAYSFALAMAVAQRDPQYFAKYTPFKEFMAFQAKRAMDAFRAGRNLKEFKYDKQETFYRNLVSGSDSAPLRDFIKKNWGESFWNEVFLGQSSTAQAKAPRQN
ncbi:MAG: hypothetical protein OZSIB_0975 [Candidatus Ozemobacter sibiricus]|jgi:hypothetical protein|uniref:Uncharacterized protein n=1 Tax=Candidatus Ozemobacter sibiricus TaxID=2268124 RepID=A0A367ZL52_9BACT|nr:MAG: hypothetical protein OZSIB_0975 [Candidatus Ozemobacter sibiricus]